MKRERYNESPNIRAELTMQNPQEVERQLTAVVEDVKPKEKGKNRWSVLYFTGPDGQSGHINVWNPHLVEGLNSGDVIDLELKRNDKGYWDIVELRRTGETKEVVPKPVTPEATPLRPFRESMDKEAAMRSMNALTAASTVTAAMIEKGLLEPKDIPEAIDAVKQFHNAFLNLHTYGNGENH